uniref:Pathogenicity determinant n=1 Tax=Tomato leaf curl Kumasi virus TaxID=548915 RepID=A0A0X8DRI4_9GEMI|nr:pathogenicity determinant [Tomato leaf curl Kumasi virus]
MGNHICIPLFSSRGNSRVPTIVSSIAYTQAVAPVSTPTIRQLSPVPMSSPTSTRTETLSSGVSFRSTEDLQEEGNRQQMMLTPRQLTQAVSLRLLTYLEN